MSSKNCTVCAGAKFLDEEGAPLERFGFFPPRGGSKCEHCGGTGWEPIDSRMLVDGGPVTVDHLELKPNGQQKDYVVLTPEERARGFVRPVRTNYVHKVCGVRTTMSRAIAETYARQPDFYSGTFCVACKTHLPLDQFVWDGTNEQVGS